MAANPGKFSLRLLPAALANRWNHRNHLFIACFPKSGSTYLAAVLHELTGFRRWNVAAKSGHNERDICRRKIAEFRRRSLITQHVKGTSNNVALLQKHGIRPIVQTRNLFDVVLSIHDHCSPTANATMTGYVHREYWSMNFSERIDYLIQIHLPWYLSFFVSWREAAKQIETLPLSYEQLFASKHTAIRSVVDFYDLSASDLAINDAITKMTDIKTRFNKGVNGRGEELLSPLQRKAISDLAAVWKIDLDEMHALGMRGDEHTDPPILGYEPVTPNAHLRAA